MQKLMLLLFIFCALFNSAMSNCEEGWRPFDNKCYHISSVSKPWIDAKADCEEKGGFLMTIKDIHERSWIRTQIGTQDMFWIGLNDIAREGVWEWSDGDIYYPYLANWREGQPDNWQDNEDCVNIVASDYGRWNDENCAVQRRYICRRLNPNPPPICDTANGWWNYSSSCYKLNSDTWKSWAAARADCVREGGDLVSILSDAEEHYVTSRLDSSHFDLWIGFSTLHCTSISCEVQTNNEKFSWSDESNEQYTNWGSAQPDLSHKETGICTALIKDTGEEYGKWRAHLCRYERPYMCKRTINTICPPGWNSFHGSCYWFVSNPNLLTTWFEAQTKCSGLGANLLTIKSEQEQFYINGFLPDLLQVDVPDIWIGLSDKDLDGSFRWVDREEITYKNWAVSHPHNVAKMWDCGQIYTGNIDGKWETANCYRKQGYVCKMAGGQNTKPPPPPGSFCDAGYILYGEDCYRFENDFMETWDNARQRCRHDQGDLASFHNPETLSFLVAHMPSSSWVGLNDKEKEGEFKWSDGTSTEFTPWEPNQPDDWQDNEDCVQLLGPEQYYSGMINDQTCDTSLSFICKKGKGKGPDPTPPTDGPGWTEKCGSWVSDPTNDFCYLFQFLSFKTWADARRDCLNQGTDLLSITEPIQQIFIQGQVASIPTGVALWMGGHDSVVEAGWEWTDGSPFRFINWHAGNPDDYYGEDCLTMRINDGYWNDDNCQFLRGYICKRRGNVPPEEHPHEGFTKAYICEGGNAAITCPHNSVINIQAAMFGRKNADICPLGSGTSETCTVDGILQMVRNRCDNRIFCNLYAYVENDPCPLVSKYMEVVYSCEHNVCVRGLGMEDGNITNAQLSASSSSSGQGPEKARLDGNTCWMPSSSTNSWIQVNLGEIKKVTGVIIQGCPGADHWVELFKVQSSVDGATWQDYVADGKELLGASDRNSKDTQLFGTPLSVQYIRILPTSFHGAIGLRMEILGCKPNFTVSCGSIPAFSFTTDRKLVHCPAGCASEPYNVFGSTVYRGDSNICAAAVHAGVILNENGGECTMLKEAGLSQYGGSTRNGITSKPYTGSFSYSYRFADGEMRCAGPDWFEFGDFCYKPFSNKLTWHAARQECRSMKAELVSIISQTEQSWLESYLYLATSDVWIGFNDLHIHNYFTWSDDHPVTFTYWAAGEPNNHDGFREDCVEMLYQNGRWNDVSCTELNTYICKKAKDHYPAPSIPPTVYGCPEGWDAYGYSCYWLEENQRTWSDAKDFCREKNSNLLHILDIYEQSHLTVKLAGYSGFWWIGLRARGNTAGGVDYIWDSGAAVTFTHWDREQPDSGDGTCVSMTSGPTGGFWDDKNCQESFPFICEGARDGISPPTPVPTLTPAEGCDKDWISMRHFRDCYRLFIVDQSKKKSWQTAREDCLMRGAELASIHSAEVEQYLATHAKGKTKWIGLQSSGVVGGYQWVDGSPLGYTNWGHGEPNNHQGRENCVEMVSSVSGSSWWNDLNCDAVQDWICMISKGKTPILPPVPPPDTPAEDCGSNPLWRKNNNICYLYNETDITDFYTAMLRCYELEAQLVSITDLQEQSYLTRMVGTGKASSAWIGLRIFGVTGGEFMWVDSSPVTFVNWAPGEPNDANGEEQCVHMSRHPGTWNDVNCGRPSAGYVCKKYPGSSHTPPPTTAGWTGHCPDGWLLFRNKCFLIKGTHHHGEEFKMNWTLARDWCKQQESHLAVINDQYENDFVASYLLDLKMPVWIGLSDILHEGKFSWNDGSKVTYTNWDTEEPNNNGEKGEHCAMMTHNHRETGRWNDGECHLEMGLVCYKTKSNSIPPPHPTKSPCASGYTSWKQNCYKLVEEPETWESAQAACRAEKGNLASIDQSYDQAFLSAAVLPVETTEAWIGLSRQDKDLYTWSDGWPVFYTHWGPGEPTNHEGEGCVAIRASKYFHGTWNDTDCKIKLPYICKTSTAKPPPTPSPGDGICRGDWHRYGQHCYYIFSETKGHSWPDSRYQCQLMHADLASIHSRAEMEFLMNLNFTKYHNLWIGLTKDISYGWAWTDGSSLAFTNWAPGEPSEILHPGGAGPEKCGEMYIKDGKWNDNKCLEKRGYICRHRQYYTTNENGDPVIPTDYPQYKSDTGTVAGIVIGVIIVLVLIAGISFYMFRVRGVQLSNIRFPSQNTIDVPTFSNPNFSGETES